MLFVTLNVNKRVWFSRYGGFSTTSVDKVVTVTENKGCFCSENPQEQHQFEPEIEDPRTVCVYSVFSVGLRDGAIMRFPPPGE